MSWPKECVVAVVTLPTTPTTAAARISTEGLTRRNKSPPTRLNAAIEAVSRPNTMPAWPTPRPSSSEAEGYSGESICSPVVATM